jgi:sialic acid synthase SpsE
MKLFNHELKEFDPFFIAEISCNHDGDLTKALSLIETAKDVGADAVKFQYYTPSDLTDKNSKTKFTSGLWGGKTLFELYTQTQTPHQWIPTMVKFANDIGIPLFPSVFNHTKIATLHDRYSFEAYKISSYECGYKELIDECVATKAHVIVSIPADAIGCFESIMYSLRTNGSILACSNEYGGTIDLECLTNYKHIQRRVYRPNNPVCYGISEHSKDSLNAYAACYNGTMIVEKHLRLYECNSADKEFSLLPHEFEKMISTCRQAAQKGLERHNTRKLGLQQSVIGATSKRKRYIVS